jgi:hypothetical protein
MVYRSIFESLALNVTRFYEKSARASLFSSLDFVFRGAMPLAASPPSKPSSTLGGKLMSGTDLAKKRGERVTWRTRRQVSVFVLTHKQSLS